MLEYVIDTAVIPFKFTIEKKKNYIPNCKCKTLCYKVNLPDRLTRAVFLTKRDHPSPRDNIALKY